MTLAALALIAVPLAFFLHGYFLYPALLRLVAGSGEPNLPSEPTSRWPRVSVLVPARNEADVIERTLRSLVGQDYPEGRRSIVVVSDASTDGTDELVSRWSDRGVTLLQLPSRRGKISAQNEAASMLDGEIIVNFDAAGQLPPSALRRLVRVFEDREIGVASGRDVSVQGDVADMTAGEGTYVDFEMWVRDLETVTGSIVGASGSFYAVRREIFNPTFPDALCRDFFSVLRAREMGYRSVSVRDAVCYVTRTRTLRSELDRKTRTMARGLTTLWHGRRFLDPFTYGSFAFKLFSHKLARWLVPLTAPLALVGLTLFTLEHSVGLILVGALAAGVGGGIHALRASDTAGISSLAAYCGYLLVGLYGGLRAWAQVLSGGRHETWTPTRREASSGAASS